MFKMLFFKQSALGTLFLSIAGLVTAAPLEPRAPWLPANNTPPSVSIGQGNGQIPYVDGRLFNIDGKTQYFAGTNTWWLAHLINNADVDKALSQIAAAELKVTRVWAFGNVNSPVEGSVYFQVLNQELSSTGAYINFDETTGIPRLDYVVSAAERYGVKLVLPLLNNWDDLGGINTYTNAFGGSETSFYTDTRSQAAYRDYVEFIVNRYKSSSAIFAWELCNEPRCRGCDRSVITNWASSTSAFIKSLDSRHMVALGDEGWFYPPESDGSYAYSGYEGVDFEANLCIKTLDYGTFHLYPDQWGYNSTWGSTWIEQHDQAGARAGKPVVLEEYGSPDTPQTTILTPWQQTVLEKTKLAYDSFWQFGTDLSSGRSLFGTGKYTIYTGTSDYQTLVVQHAKDMLAKPP